MAMSVFTFLVPCWAISLEHWQCLVYFPAQCDSIVHDAYYIYIYICLHVCGWICTLYDGLSWLCKRPSLVIRGLDLVVWVCAQGDCYRCIFMLYCVHHHRSVIVLIHVIKWHWFPCVCDAYQHVLTHWRASPCHSASISILVVYIDPKPYQCTIAHQTRNSIRFSPWKWGIPIVIFSHRKFGENSVWRAMTHLRRSTTGFPPCIRITLSWLLR